MIEPPSPWRFIARAPCLMPRNTPRTSTANVKSQSSTASSVSGPNAPPMPALLNTMSTPAELAHRRVDHGLDVGLFGDVGLTKRSVLRVAVGRRRLEELLADGVVQVRDHHARAFGQEAQRRRAPHAARTAGDHCNLALEPSRHSPSARSAVAASARSGRPSSASYSGRGPCRRTGRRGRGCRRRSRASGRRLARREHAARRHEHVADRLGAVLGLAAAAAAVAAGARRRSSTTPRPCGSTA